MNRSWRWEMVLAAVVFAVLLLNAVFSPHFFEPWTLSDVSFGFTEKAIVALPVALLIIAREIDVSVAGIIALASVVMGLCAQAGADTAMLVAVGLGTGLAAGMVNGLIVTRYGVWSIVATIGTMSLFRGVAYSVLGDRAIKGYPADFAFFGQGHVAGPLSFELLLFVVLALVFAIVLHRTVIGRRIYAIGANDVAARHAGIRVDRYRFWLFSVTGLCCGLSAILLTSRLGSTRPSIAQGWELDIISMVILGGVAVSGGRGTVAGVVLAALLMGLITFSLGLLNVPGIVMSIVIGSVIIAVVALPAATQRIASWRNGRAEAGRADGR
jgi:rhamnose transport system permease protein